MEDISYQKISEIRSLCKAMLTCDQYCVYCATKTSGSQTKAEVNEEILYQFRDLPKLKNDKIISELKKIRRDYIKKRYLFSKEEWGELNYKPRSIDPKNRQLERDFSKRIDNMHDLFFMKIMLLRAEDRRKNWFHVQAYTGVEEECYSMIQDIATECPLCYKIITADIISDKEIVQFETIKQLRGEDILRQLNFIIDGEYPWDEITESKKIFTEKVYSQSWKIWKEIRYERLQWRKIELDETELKSLLFRLKIFQMRYNLWVENQESREFINSRSYNVT